MRVAGKIIIVVKPNLEKSLIVPPYHSEKICMSLAFVKISQLLLSCLRTYFAIFFWPWDRQFNSGTIEL